MSRRLIAIGIAVVLSTPLILLLRTSIERLMGTDAPVVVPSPGWKVRTQKIADQYQQTINVYRTADDAGNHFVYRGRISSVGGADYVPPMDEISTNADCPQITCITARFLSHGNNWGGWYFLNGVLSSKDRQPVASWGDEPNAGYDLSGATKLQFKARGDRGGEKVEFFAFGVGNTTPPFMPYPDSAPKHSSGEIVLSTTWTQYEIPLPPNLDLHYVLGGFGWVAVAGPSENTQDITFYLADISYVKPRPSDDRLLISYDTIKSTNAFDSAERNAAFVYDNAVAAIAFAASGDLTHARFIGNSFITAQSHDRFFRDGRVRNAYQGGDLLLPPGWVSNSRPNTMRMPGWYDPVHRTWFEDENHVSTNTGNIAWTMLSQLFLYETTQEVKYLNSAATLGDWVIANTEDTRGAGGFTAGYEGWEGGAVSGASSSCASSVFLNGQCKRLYKSSEHNIDLYSAFSRLYVAQKDDKWRQKALNAKRFFLSMWDPTEGKFWTGTAEDGVTISKDVVPLDIQVWSLLALGAESTSYLRALDYIEAHHKTRLGYGFKQSGGNACGDNTWFEGTSQVATAYAFIGNLDRWSAILQGIRTAQADSGAVPATDGACLNTGFTLNDGQPWLYYPRAHVGATAWLSIAESKINPFRSDLYSSSVNAQPTVVSLSPSSGATSGGTQITITGTNFIPGAAEVLGSVPTTNVIYVNPTTLRALTPSGSGTVSVTVTNPDGQSATLANAFVYPAAAPTVLTGDADPTSYLSGYGITVTLGPNSKLVVESDIVFPYLHPTTEHNFLALLRTANPQVDSATLNFATPLSSISFDRIGATGLLTPQWSATAYDAQGHVVGSVGEPFGNGWSTPKTYTISGSGITQLALSGNGFNIAGADGPMLDTFVLTPATTPSGRTPITITGSNFVSSTVARLGGTAATNARFVSPATLFTVTRPAATFLRAAEEPATPILTDHVDRGWYALNLARAALSGAEAGEHIDLEFVSDEGKRKTFSLTKSGFSSGEGLAWIYFAQRGSLRVRGVSVERQPTLRQVKWSEFIDRTTDLAFDQALFTARLYIEFLVMCAYIFSVYRIQKYAYDTIGRLPLNSRGRAQRQVDRMVAVAEWGGVISFFVLVLKELLIEIGFVGIVFVM